MTNLVENDILKKVTIEQHVKIRVATLLSDYKNCNYHKSEYPATSKAKSKINTEQYDRLFRVIPVKNPDILIDIVGLDLALGNDGFVSFTCELTGKTYPEIKQLYFIDGLGDYPFFLCMEKIKEWLND